MKEEDAEEYEEEEFKLLTIVISPAAKVSSVVKISTVSPVVKISIVSPVAKISTVFPVAKVTSGAI